MQDRGVATAADVADGNGYEPEDEPARAGPEAEFPEQSAAIRASAAAVHSLSLWTCSGTGSMLTAIHRSSIQSRMSMAPTQRTNPNTSRFFTTRPLPVLVSLLSRALATLDLPSAASASSSISPSNAPPPFELLYSTSEAYKAAKSEEAPSLEYLDSAPLGTLFARFRIVSIDRRREPLQAGLHITKSILPAENAAGGGAMDVDGAEHSEAQLEGLDITFLKRKADPLEMKRLWRKLLAKMPEGVIVAT